MGYNSVADIRSIFIRLAVVASQSREITRNSDKIWPYTTSRSSKVIDLGVNRKPRYDFLLVSNFGRICYRFRDIDAWSWKIVEFSHRTLVWGPARGNPLEFGDEIWRRKTRVLALPDGEEIMTLAFFVLTQYRRVTNRLTDRRTDGQTDTLRSLLPALE